MLRFPVSRIRRGFRPRATITQRMIQPLTQQQSGDVTGRLVPAGVERIHSGGKVLSRSFCASLSQRVPNIRPQAGMEHRLPRHNFFDSRDEISFTCHRRSPSTKRADSTRSAARNQLFPEVKMVTGSSAARSVQLNGISHWRPFLSRKQTRSSRPYSFHVRASNSRPGSG